MYGFVQQNPINGIDPYGLKKDCPKDCEKQYWGCLNKWFLPGIADVFQGLFNASGYYMHMWAWNYAAKKMLIYPLKSSIFRPWYYLGQEIGPRFAVGYFTFVVWWCLKEEIECLMNQ
jgi:hypothetical protein